MYFTTSEFVVSIIDTGCGIKKENLEKIFDPFFTTKEVGKGTGIGLSLVFNFIKELEGKISVESQIGEGSKFILKLPFDKQKSLSQIKTKPSVINENKKPLIHELISKKILFVDDDDDLRSFFSDFLIENGFEVNEACDGAEALEIYLNNPEQFELIISDVKMPRVNGIDLLKAIRQNSQIKKQPKFIILTGGVNIDFQNENHEVYNMFEKYLYKPFDENDLLNTISDIFKKNVNTNAA